MSITLPVDRRANETRSFNKERRKVELHLYKKFKNLYLWHKAYYDGFNKSFRVGCKSHGFFITTPKQLLSHSFNGCPSCLRFKKQTIKHNCIYKGIKYTHTSFVAACQKVHGKKYHYELTKFKGFGIPLKVTCTIHNKTTTVKNPASHLEGKISCKKCRGQKQSLTTAEYIKKAKLIHGDTYTYTNTLYTTARSPIIITCNTHGDFILQKASYHTIGKIGCNKCNLGGFKNTKPGVLYYLSINNGQAYKIGITNGSVETRYSNADLRNITILQTQYYANGIDARNEETRILREFKDMKYTGPKLLTGCGIQELFHTDILQLDKPT